VILWRPLLREARSVKENDLCHVSITRCAELLIRDLGITSLPVCPFSIAQALDIAVKALPSDSQGVSGILLRHDNQYGILYSTWLENDGFQRFSVAHELGHYSLPGHPDSVPSGHASNAGFVSKDKYELEADYFAASLLMPRDLFKAAMNKAGVGLEAIEKLTGQCNTSLTATAIRYAKYTQDAVAVIMSTGSEIDYCFMSDCLKEIQGLTWPGKSSSVPRNTATHAFNNDPGNITSAKRRDGRTSLQLWFGGNIEVNMLEEVVGMGRYGKTLTVLSTERLPDQEELEEEEKLIESWTPRF